MKQLIILVIFLLSFSANGQTKFYKSIYNVQSINPYSTGIGIATGIKANKNTVYLSVAKTFYNKKRTFGQNGFSKLELGYCRSINVTSNINFIFGSEIGINSIEPITIFQKSDNTITGRSRTFIGIEPYYGFTCKIHRDIKLILTIQNFISSGTIKFSNNTSQSKIYFTPFIQIGISK